MLCDVNSISPLSVDLYPLCMFLQYILHFSASLKMPFQSLDLCKRLYYVGKVQTLKPIFFSQAKAMWET